MLLEHGGNIEPNKRSSAQSCFEDKNFTANWAFPVTSVALIPKFDNARLVIFMMTPGVVGMGNIFTLQIRNRAKDTSRLSNELGVALATV